MLSINPFLQPPRDRRVEALHRVISVLLQGMALHSFSYDSTEFEAFQRALRKLRDEIAQVDDDDSAVILAGSAVRTLEEHQAAAERATTSRQNELEAAMALISDCLLAVGRVSERLALELKESERDTAAARSPAEIAAARARLGNCLEEIRVAVLRRRKAALLASHRYLENELDPVTGLPDSRKAVDALAAAWDQRSDYHAVIFAVRRLETINARYGFQAGDEILRVASHHLAGIFEGSRLLFRWRGPHLLALVNKQTEEYRIAPELHRLTSTRLQHTLAVKDREVILSISIGWTLVALEAKGVEEMIDSLDSLSTTKLR